ncbi:MAG: Tetratricopeptide 2 repeat protein, partial [Bryobacterales bacterium]|nr:Tetratricopeptide 2 repeat protein [Bryobacterales bacterium]
MRVCAGCHPAIFQTYRQSGMGRSFYRPQTGSIIEDYTNHNSFYHAASDTHYVMLQRDGKFFQRSYQIGYDGKETSVDEKSIDFVLGSGNHARTYLHRTAQGALVQLPLGWYSEKGGYWAMSPGYDMPNHPGAHRPIGLDCMFCHNAYPRTSAAPDRFGDVPVFTGSMPEGIDCQRCHGSAQQHIAAAQIPGAKPESIRRTILNPASLSLDRQMEVCLQCHLQPNSFRPTLNFKKYGRDYLSYQPGEPLSAFMVFFDAQESPGTDRFQIAGSAYRLRQSSACFVKSRGALQCTTCHNPHLVRHGAEASQVYNSACLTCHAQPFQALVKAGRHTSATGCVDCHMPKRRTQDVVHVAMTDHYIRRTPLDGNLLAELAEVHDAVGTPLPKPVRLYYPGKVAPAPENRLALAVAQIRESVNLKVGIPLVARLLQTERPSHPDPYFELAEAYRKQGQSKEAVPLYKEALRQDARYLPALLALGATLNELGQRSQAAETLRGATAWAPSDAPLWNALGRVELDGDRPAEAATAFRKAIALDPDLESPHIGLGISLARTGAVRDAETEFRDAIRLQPNSGEAHANLADLLIFNRNFPEAAWEFERAVRLEPTDVPTRLRYATLLYTLRRNDEAQQQVEA